MTARQEVRLLTLVMALVSFGIGFLDVILGLIFGALTAMCAATGYALTHPEDP